MTPIDRVLSALEAHGCRPRKVRTGWEARCPIHNDRKPSLSLSIGDNRAVLLRCHAGCPLEAITAALGMKVKDLFPTETRSMEIPRQMKTLALKKTSPKNGKAYPTANEALKAYGLGKPKKWWAYYREDESKPCQIVARWETSEGKMIRPVFRDSAGWKQGALPAPRPLYRLRELLESPKATLLVNTLFLADFASAYLRRTCRVRDLFGGGQTVPNHGELRDRLCAEENCRID